MNDNKWHSGPPPSCGWWPASESRNSGIYRWWDGAYWSMSALESDSKKDAGFFALEKSSLATHTIQWKHRPDSWPARSRT